MKLAQQRPIPTRMEVIAHSIRVLARPLVEPANMQPTRKIHKVPSAAQPPLPLRSIQPFPRKHGAGEILDSPSLRNSRLKREPQP
jgi:hypothetical protein